MEEESTTFIYLLLSQNRAHLASIESNTITGAREQHTACLHLISIDSEQTHTHSRKLTSRAIILQKLAISDNKVKLSNANGFILKILAA